MSKAIIIIGLIIACLGSVISTTWYWLEGRRISLKIIFSVATFLFSVCLLSLVIKIKAESESSCLEYETTMVFDAATKTIMPVRSCKKYVEWVGGARR